MTGVWVRGCCGTRIVRRFALVRGVVLLVLLLRFTAEHPRSERALF